MNFTPFPSVFSLVIIVNKQNPYKKDFEQLGQFNKAVTIFKQDFLLNLHTKFPKSGF